MKIIYVNCFLRNEYEISIRQTWAKLSLMALHKFTISTFMCEIICLLEIGGCTCLTPRGCIMGGHK